MSTTTQPATIAPPGTPPQVRVEMRSNPLFLSGIREMVVAVAKRFGFPDETGGQIALAVDEALCNVIRHGYHKHPDRPIWLSIWAEGGAWKAGTPEPTGGVGDERPDAMRIVIEDEAQQVDPEQIRSRSLEEIRPGGLGVHIIKTVMDQAVYEKRGGGEGGRGMRLTMIKKRVGSTMDGPKAGPRGGGCGCSNPGKGSEACHG